MITLSASGGSVTFTFSGNSTYLNDGTIEVPVNSLALIIDESDMATFRKAASNDIFVSANIAEFGMTKAELESWYKANMVGSTGGGGGVTSGEVQTMIDEAVSGKQDTLVSGTNIKTINNESLLGSGNITIQGGGGGTVDETPIYTIWENDFRDVSQSINVRKAILDFQGDKSITTGTYVYVQILNKTSGQWYYPNATLNYVEGTYTKREDDNNYLVVEYNSEIEDFIISVSDDYPNAILFSVSFYSNKIKIESATIESGDTSDVIETSVANIFGDLYTKDLNSVNMTSLEVASPKNLRLVSEKKNGTNNSQSIKLDDLIVTVNGADKTFSTDIKVPLGTSGWTEVSDISASRCNVEYLGEPLPFTSFRITYNTNDMGMINLRLRAGTTSFSTMFYINWDSSLNKFVVSNETFSATTITLDTTNHILTVELPATVEYGGTQGQTILFALNSDSCQFGYSITKLEYYGEEKQDLIPYIQQLRSDVDGKLDSSDVTTAVTSGSTDAEIPTAKAVYDAIGQGGGGGTDAPISASTGTDSIKENYVNNVASGEYSHAEGRGTSASGNSSHAEGNGTSAKGNYAHAEGHSTVASGDSSHAEGELTNANGSNSHAEGSNTKANGSNSHAEGKYSQASGQTSHAEGDNTRANGTKSHAEGGSTVANGESSHAEGSNTIANNQAEHASGMYNVSNTGESASAQTLFSVGNGGWDETAQDVVRHNAFEVRQNGDIYCSDGTNDVKLQDTITATAANTTALGGLSLVKLTESEYAALVTKDPNVLYVVIPDPQYRWTQSGTTCIGYDKYQNNIKEQSIDGGVTWTVVIPEEYSASTLIESQSTDCGYIPPTAYTYSITIQGLTEGFAPTVSIDWGGEHTDTNLGNGTYTYTTSSESLSITVPDDVHGWHPDDYVNNFTLTSSNNSRTVTYTDDLG